MVYSLVEAMKALPADDAMNPHAQPRRRPPRRRIFGVLALLLACCAAPAFGQKQALKPGFVAKVERPWTGDLDGMVKRRLVRFLVPYSKTLYMVDRGRQMGITAEAGQAFEAWLNARYAKGHLKIRVVFLPEARDALLPDLVAGKGDVAAGALTITPERLASVDFAAPWVTDVREIVIAGPTAPTLATLDDLSGKDVCVRRASPYFTSLERLNQNLAAKALAPVQIRSIDEDLEDDDILQMVSAGILPYTIVDDYTARVWARILPGLTIRDDLALRDDGAIGWAIRKTSPLLQKELAAFVAAHGIQTSFGATVMRRYFTGPEALRNSASPQALQRFRELLSGFEKAGEKYGFDDLLLMAQGFQESQLDQSRRSPRGAVGVMQVLPSTAAAPPLNITGVDRDVEANVEAGAAYLRLVRDRYVNDPALKEPDRTLMTFAAYNAGPGNFLKIRRAAISSGLDPHLWFNNVETGAAKVIGRETVQYVANIFNYYVSFRLAKERDKAKMESKAARVLDAPPR
jgi:membrane-bound lytic murein transglycosylase MltF